ncbi:MAG: tetratricopeptide repeat protein [Crocinitomicaceae bacterium]
MASKLAYILFFIPFYLNAQLPQENQKFIDSLKGVISSAKNDTIIINAWREWDRRIYLSDPAMDLKLNQHIDSLCQLNLSKNPNEKLKEFYLKSRISSLNNMGIYFKERGAYDQAIQFYETTLELAKKTGDEKRVALLYNNIGLIHSERGNYPEAIKFYNKSMDIIERIDYKRGKLMILSNFGLIYMDKGEYSEAIKYFTESMQLAEELELPQRIINGSINIGHIYYDQGIFDKALEYYESALEKSKEIDYKEGMSGAYNCIGNVYYYKNDFTSTINYYQKSLEIDQKIGNQSGVAMALNNIGLVYSDQRKMDQAITYYKESLKIREELGDPKAIAATLINIGTLYYRKGNFLKGLEYSDKGLQIAREVGAAVQIRDAAGQLSENYKKLRKYREALEYYELYIASRDSIVSESNQKEIIRQEYKYHYEKQALQDSIQNAEAQKLKDAELAAEKAESKRLELQNEQQKEQKYFLFGGLAMALIFGGFVFNRFRVTRKQKLLIEKQKEIVDEAYEELEEKNKEITDSIAYAKRIQSAILPPQKLVKSYLNNSFILYKPKDVVAGDFYWMETVVSNQLSETSEAQNKLVTILFAVADCTGHGVPGAMVSVICNNGLNRSVREHGLSDPGKILDKTREIVIQEFEKSEEEVKDGMDIALVRLAQNEKQNENEKSNPHSSSSFSLCFAGAHNPLWIIRNGKVNEEEFKAHCAAETVSKLSFTEFQDNTLIEVKADKQPIGRFKNPVPFSSHTIQLQKGDAIYLFSDGYADQFGGEKGKKFKTANLKKLFLSIQNEKMDKQRELLSQTFEDWKGKLEQLDDVCVIGVKV